jgi:alkylated DNA repair protein (DNA oxidative demethylase)
VTEPLFPGRRRVIAPGAVHVPGWLDVEQQRQLVDACREWARGPVPMRAAELPSGHRMSVRTVCLGWHWRPYAYTRTADDVDGRRVADFPAWLGNWGRAAVAEACGADAGHGPGAREYRPDTALINFYDEHARMGMHRDVDERTSDPVVSLSLGDRCVFRFGNTENRKQPWTDVTLESGDLFVFGGPSRFAYHGVPSVHPGTADPRTGVRRGRLNITMRVTGLSTADDP